MSDTNTRPREILARRAKELARPLETGMSHVIGGGSMTSLLVARIDGERVGIALDHIIEVHRVVDLTSIPGARAPVAGAIAWRGRVLTVLDIAPARRGEIAIGDATRLVVLGHQRAAFGIVVDDVENVEDVDMKKTVAVTELLPARRELVRGVTADALVVLDIAALIARFAPTR